MSIEVSIDELTAQTSELLDVCVTLKNSISQQISDAVIASTNAAVVPLITVATNLITTQTMIITHL